MSDEVVPTVAVAGRFDRSLADFERACLVHIEDEQQRPNPDNALIALLCDAVRLARETARAVTAEALVERLSAALAKIPEDILVVYGAAEDPDAEDL